MTGIPGYLRIPVCPRFNNPWSYEWKEEIEMLQWRSYGLYI